MTVSRRTFVTGLLATTAVAAVLPKAAVYDPRWPIFSEPMGRRSSDRERAAQEAYRRDIYATYAQHGIPPLDNWVSCTAPVIGGIATFPNGMTVRVV